MGQSVWTITHNLGIKPVSDSWVDVNGVLTKILPVSVIHLDDNTLQLTFSTPSVGGVRVAGINVADTLVGAGTIDGEISPPNVAEDVPIEFHINTFSPSAYWNNYLNETGAAIFTGGGGKIDLLNLPSSETFRKIGPDTIHTNDVAFAYPDSTNLENAAVAIDTAWDGAQSIMWETKVETTTPVDVSFSYYVPVTGTFDPNVLPKANDSDYIVTYHSRGYIQLADKTEVFATGWNGSDQPTIGMTLTPTNSGQLKFYVNGIVVQTIDNVPNNGFPVLSAEQFVESEYDFRLTGLVYQKTYETVSGEALIMPIGGHVDQEYLPSSPNFRTIGMIIDNAVAFRAPLGVSGGDASIVSNTPWDGINPVAFEVFVGTSNMSGVGIGYYVPTITPFNPDLEAGGTDFNNTPVAPGSSMYYAGGFQHAPDGSNLIGQGPYGLGDTVGVVLTAANGGTLIYFVNGEEISRFTDIGYLGGYPMLFVPSNV